MDSDQWGQGPELMPGDKGSDDTVTPADQGSGAGGTAPSGDPAWTGLSAAGPAGASPGTPLPGTPLPSAPGQFSAAPPGGYPPPSPPQSYPPQSYQPQGSQAPGGQSWYSDQGGSAGFEAPPESAGYQPTASPGYEAPGGSSGFQAPGEPPGYQAPGESSGYQAPGLSSGYQAPGYQAPSYQAPGYEAPSYQAPGYQTPGYQTPGYQAPGYQTPGYEAAGYEAAGGPPGFQAPGAPPGYQGTVPLPGDVAAGPQAGSYSGGWGSAMPPGGYVGTQPQQGYPGGQGMPGTGWPSVPQTQPKRRRGLLIGVVALVAALVAGGVTAVVLVLHKGESPTQMAMQAGQALAPAPGVTLSGTFDNASASLSVTKAGTVEGTYQQQAFQATRITINGVTYLKVPAGFWNLQPSIGQAAASQAGGKWAKTPSDDVTDFTPLTPAKIAHVLEHVGPQPSVADTTLGGTKVIKLTADGATYYITTATPNRLLRIDGTLGSDSYSFNVTTLTAGTIAPVFTVMHSYVGALQGAQDPAANLTSGANINFANNCSTSDTACTVSINVSVTDPDSAAVIVTMNAAFSGTKGGTAFGNCDTTVTANTSNSSTQVNVTPSCTLSGAPWTGWVDSQTGTFTTWVDTTFGAEVNTSSDVSTLQTTLNQQQG